ncbi:MAG: Phenylacetic acid catabolic protein [Candidatus Binataceae bacterium]
MPVGRRFAPGALGADDIRRGGVEARYVRVLTRLLAAHAMAEKLTAFGYQRALETAADRALRRTIEKNLAEERKHARLIYRLLAEIGVSQEQADRLMVTAIKGPSFEAPRYFAESAAGELDLIMGSISLDSTGMIIIGINYRESSYAPHARCAAAILEEEAEHESFGAGALIDAVERFGHKPVEIALREWLPRAVNFFGPPGSGFTFDCLSYGLKARDNQELAQLFMVILERRLERLGLKLPTLTSVYPHQVA